MTVTQSFWIDGVEYKVPLLNVDRTADTLDASAERMEDGDIDRELIGVYLNYDVAVGIVDDDELYEKLYDKLTEPVRFHDFKIPRENGKYHSFKGYIGSQVKDKYKKILKHNAKFEGLTFNIVSKKPTRKPSDMKGEQNE